MTGTRRVTCWLPALFLLASIVSGYIHPHRGRQEGIRVYASNKGDAESRVIASIWCGHMDRVVAVQWGCSVVEA